MRAKTADRIGNIFAAIVIAAAVGFGIWWEYGNWQECLADHSFFYCAYWLSE